MNCKKCGCLLSSSDIEIADGYCSVVCNFSDLPPSVQYNFSSLSSKQKGDIGETTVILEALKRGYRVCNTVGDNARYDLIIDDGEKLAKVQVKSVFTEADTITVSLSSVSYDKDTGKPGRKANIYDSSEIDYILAVTVYDGNIYKIPPEMLNGLTKSVKLRRTPTSHEQRKGVNWAHRYRW